MHTTYTSAHVLVMVPLPEIAPEDDKYEDKELEDTDLPDAPSMSLLEDFFEPNVQI